PLAPDEDAGVGARVPFHQLEELEHLRRRRDDAVKAGVLRVWSSQNPGHRTAKVTQRRVAVKRATGDGVTTADGAQRVGLRLSSSSLTRCSPRVTRRLASS